MENVSMPATLPLCGRLKIGNDDDLVRLNDAAWQVLEKTGFKVCSDRILDRLVTLGARVDHGTQVATFPRELLRDVLGCELLPEPAETPIAASPHYHASFGEVCFFLLDWETGERRRATRADTIDLIRLGHAIPEVRIIGTPVVNSEINQRAEVIEAATLLIANSDKPGGTGIRCPEQTDYMVELTKLCEKHGDPRRFVQKGGCLTSPLALGDRTAQIVERLLDLGYDTFAFSSMPIAGGNAPVTTAGCVVMAVAELLGGRLVARAYNPEAQGAASVISGTLDMTNGKASFCSPQAVMQDILVWRIFRRLYGCSIGLDRRASYINAKVPGLQCAYERTFKQMALAATTGTFDAHLGTLDGAATFSREQAMIDLDLGRGLYDFCKGIQINDDTLALDQIDSVGIGHGRTFVNTDHTLNHFRDALWMPSLLDTSMWHDNHEAEPEQRILEKANRQWKAHLESYTPPQVNADLLAEMTAVVERAERELA